MYCRHCGNEVSDKAIMCVACGAPPKTGNAFCYNCRAESNPNTSVCLTCGVSLKNNYFTNLGDGKDWLTTLLLCFFLGVFGVHRFYTKHIGIGVIQLLTLGGCGIWALIDLIMIITNVYKDGDGNPLERN